jgi:DNA-binding MarR family transcriptional regulator
VDAPTLSRAVGRLEDKGLVRRKRDPKDGRAVTVEPSAAGKKLLQRLREARNDVLCGRLRELDAGERRLLHAALPVLEALADAVKQERVRA